jgi:hypothetical protein
MLSKSLKNLLLITLVAFSFTVTFSQEDNKNEKKSDSDGIGLKETMAKWRIKKENEDYQDLLKKGEEASKIAEELKTSYGKNQKLSDVELKKLDRLEKLLKKIIDELGADEGDLEEVDSKKFISINNAVNFLQETSSKLLTELKKNTKHSVSVIAIESSNFLIKVVRFIRFNKN